MIAVVGLYFFVNFVVVVIVAATQTVEAFRKCKCRKNKKVLNETDIEFTDTRKSDLSFATSEVRSRAEDMKSIDSIHQTIMIRKGGKYRTFFREERKPR